MMVSALFEAKHATPSLARRGRSVVVAKNPFRVVGRTCQLGGGKK